MPLDVYQILGVSSRASSAEIKTAYRALVKKHHPDKGGDEKQMLAINAAWEILGDPDHRLAYDKQIQNIETTSQEIHKRSVRNASASAAANLAKGQIFAEEEALSNWLQNVYIPIDKLLGQVINPFSSELKSLSADPYDDSLMEKFCSYIEKSQQRLKKVCDIYQSIPTPIFAKDFSLNLYHCFSQVVDAFSELERYTMGYVDSYLHDGRQMLKEAKNRRLALKEERRRLEAL